MKAGKYSFRELFVNRYVEKLVIPEIQRDYVWEKTQVDGLLSSIAVDFSRFQTVLIPRVDGEGSIQQVEQLTRDFEAFYRQRNCSSNIGFIYAYSDAQYEGRYFLIDGQQRITTIYLTLLLLASRNGLGSEFCKHYCIQEEPKLDYRVRESAHRFLYKLVPYVLEHLIDGIQEQNWYLKIYDRDVTIRHILASLHHINHWLDDQKSLDERDFYGYLCDYTECWYFDTNISAQGENLYIYLNARGEQMQGNENLKADLLSRIVGIESKNYWGEEWEVWQDYFWQRRGKGLRRGKNNPNADAGFNEFLGCITGLQMYLQGTGGHWLNDELARDCTPQMLAEMLNLQTIKSFIAVFQYLDGLEASVQLLYDTFDWYQKCLNEIWQLLNQEKTRWVTEKHGHPNLATEQRRMMLVWGIIHWVSIAKGDKTTEIVIRGIRQFYLRYHNNIRSIPKLKADIDRLYETGLLSTEEKDEEFHRERWLADIQVRDDRLELETLLWSIEDHPLNLDGSDVGMTNILHLVQLDPAIPLRNLRLVKEAFYKCFTQLTSPQKANRPELQSLLLHYGDYWRRITPWYYENYEFSEWRRIIRQTKKGESPAPFSKLMDVLVANPEKDVADLLADKREHEPVVDAADGLRALLLWYNFHLGERMWQQGAYIALCDHQSKHKYDQVFPEKRTFINTKGDFKGNSRQVLSDLLPKEVLDAVVVEEESA